MANRNRNRKPKQEYEKRGYTKDKRNFQDKDASDVDVKHDYNDQSWYSHNPQLLADVAAIPFSQLVGVPTIRPTQTPTVATRSPKWTVPGVWRITYVPGVGVSKDSTSAVNIAAKNIYADIRYKNSGRKNYDAPDYMLYLAAVCNAFATYAHLKRIYGVARYYSAVNRYAPYGILQALGVDPEEVLNDLNDLRSRLNMFSARLCTFVVPSVMSLYLRQYWLNTNVYRDCENDKSQFYVFVPDIYYTYNEKTSTTGGFLEAHQINNSAKASLQDWYDIIDSQIEAIMNSEDIGLMMGDTLKRFEGNVFTVDDCPEDYMVVPVHNLTVLSQIQNANAVGVIDEYTLPAFNVRQDPDTGAIIWNPEFKCFCPVSNMPKTITLPIYNPTPGDVMEATRLTHITTRDYGASDGSLVCELEHSGTEICTTFAIYQFFYDTQATPKWDVKVWGSWFEGAEEHILSDVPESRMGEEDYAYALRILGAISAFNFHPEIRFWNGAWTDPDEGQEPTYSAAFYEDSSILDVENYALVSEYNLGRIHDVAVLSEFSVPLERSGSKV